MKHLELDTNHRYRWLLAAFLILLSLSIGAQNLIEGELFSLDPEPVTGHSFGAVTAIAQSPADGSLWIGTGSEGILRIGRNGNRIRYTVETNHLLSNAVSQLCFVSPSVLYILYMDGCLTRYSSTEGFSPINNISDRISHILAGGNDGQLLFATEGGSVFTSVNRSNPALLFNLGEPISAIALSNNDNLIAIGARSKTVFKFSDGNPKAVTAPLVEVASCLAVSPEGKIWAGTGQGLYQWSDDGWTLQSTESGLISNRIKSILFGRQGELLIVSSSGVQALNVSNSNVSKQEVYFPGESFSCAAESSKDDVVFYFGGEHGIAAISSNTQAQILPWNNTPGEKDNTVNKYSILFWILSILAIGISAFFAGRYFSKNKRISKEDTQTPPSTRIPAIKPNTEELKSVVPEDVQTTVPPSHDDVFSAIDTLNRGKAPEFSLKVWKMIQDSYTDQEFSVADIADRLLLSRVHLNRKLQQEIGVSPSSILKACRMTAARELMVQGGLSIQQIAQMTGFSSAAFLSTSFKDYYGQTPSDVMKKS